MSASPPRVTEQQVQEDLLRLDAYRNQLSSLLQQHEILSASRQDHVRAREGLEGVDRAPPTAEFLLPLGGETFVRGSVDQTAPVLVGVGSGEFEFMCDRRMEYPPRTAATMIRATMTAFDRPFMPNLL